MTNEQNSDADARTEALEDHRSVGDGLAKVAEEISLLGFLAFGTISCIAAAVLQARHPESSAATIALFPAVVTFCGMGLWGLVDLGKTAVNKARAAVQRWRGAQKQNQSRDTDEDMDSKQNSEQEVSA